MRTIKKRMQGPLAFLLTAGMAAQCGAQVHFNPEAVRHNNGPAVHRARRR